MLFLRGVLLWESPIILVGLLVGWHLALGGLAHLFTHNTLLSATLGLLGSALGLRKAWGLLGGMVADANLFRAQPSDEENMRSCIDTIVSLEAVALRLVDQALTIEQLVARRLGVSLPASFSLSIPLLFVLSLFFNLFSLHLLAWLLSFSLLLAPGLIRHRQQIVAFVGPHVRKIHHNIHLEDFVNSVLAYFGQIHGVNNSNNHHHNSQNTNNNNNPSAGSNNNNNNQNNQNIVRPLTPQPPAASSPYPDHYQAEVLAPTKPYQDSISDLPVHPALQASVESSSYSTPLSEPLMATPPSSPLRSHRPVPPPMIPQSPLLPQAAAAWDRPYGDEYNVAPGPNFVPMRSPYYAGQPFPAAGLYGQPGSPARGYAYPNAVPVAYPAGAPLDAISAPFAPTAPPPQASNDPYVHRISAALR